MIPYLGIPVLDYFDRLQIIFIRSTLFVSRGMAPFSGLLEQVTIETDLLSVNVCL